MSLPTYLSPQRDFSAGQLDGTAARRDDTDVMKKAARAMRNLEVMGAGGFRRRPGTTLASYGSNVFLVEPVVGVIFACEFGAGFFRARNVANNVVQTVTAPWTIGIVPSLRWALMGQQIFVVTQSLRPQVLTIDPTSYVWSIAPFAFAVGANGQTAQPFYRFADKGVSMQPASSALAGSGTAAFSANVLSASQVGTEYRWNGRRMQYTGFIDRANGTFTNLEQLPPSQLCVFPNVNGYRVGDAVQGATSNVQGQIVAIDTVAFKLSVVITNKYSGLVNTEAVVSPQASVALTSSTFPSPFASTVWDEAFMSDFRGWPGNVAVDRQRLVFCDFAQLPAAIIESQVGNPFYFDIGVNADDAFFEIVPQNERVLHVVGGSDQFIFTDKTIYYIPVSSSNPLGPGTIEFRAITTGGASSVVPVRSFSSLLYMSGDNKRLMAVRNIGYQAKPYVAYHLSKYHSQLLNNPVDMGVSVGQVIDSAEIIYLVNADGSVISGRYEEEAEFIGFVPWAYQGFATGVAAYKALVYFSFNHTLAGVLTQTLEFLDYSQNLDCAFNMTSSQGGAAMIPFAGYTMDSIVNGGYAGTYVVSGAGTVTADLVTGDVRFGFNHVPSFTPFTRNFEGGQSQGQRMRLRKIKDCGIVVLASGPLKVDDGQDLGGYGIYDDMSIAPPLVNDTHKFKVTGRSYDPQVTINQPLPYPLQVLEFGMELTG